MQLEIGNEPMLPPQQSSDYVSKKVKVLVYSLVLAAAAKTSLTLPPGERTPLNLHRISKCCTFYAPIDPLSVQSGSNQGFTPCLRVLLCGLTWVGIEPTASSMEVRRLNYQATTSPLYFMTKFQIATYYTFRDMNLILIRPHAEWCIWALRASCTSGLKAHQ